VKNIAHCNLVTGENGVTVLEDDLNHIELRIILTDELVELSKTEPINLYKIDQAGATTTVESFTDIETNEISVSFGDAESDYETGEVQYYVGATGYTSEIIKFNIAETLYAASDDVYIEYTDGVFEIKKTVVNGEKYLDMYPIGSVYITNTKKDPSGYFGGTWECIDKEFVCVSNSTGFTNDKVSSSSFIWVRSGHTIYCRLTFTNSTTLNDTQVKLGKIDCATLGVTDLTYDKFPVGYTDGGGAFLMITIDNAGDVTVEDVVDKGGTNQVSSGASCRVDFTCVIPHENMLESACSKFYWKRTA
jgi:hypothetical protein